MSYQNKKWYKDLKASNPDCIYCGETLNNATFSVDHIIPQKEGGKDSPENCKPCCKVCNGLKLHMSHDDFVRLYPKEKILRIKKESNKYKELDGIEFMDDVYNVVNNISDSMKSLLDKREYLLEFRNESQVLADDINDEITFSERTSASEGFKKFSRLREVNRKLVSCNNEVEFIDSYIDKLKSINKDINNILISMNHKINYNKHSKIDRSLLEDAETVKRMKLESKRNRKVYSFSKIKSGIKIQEMHLNEVWNNVQRDDKSKTFKCSGRKN